MKRWWICWACLAILMGCKPTPDSSQEDKEPNYLAGRRQVQQRDWAGAERSFHKSLEANPGSSLAHYELGVIYLSHKANPAAAIYHLDRYLTLNPQVANRDEVRGHIAAAKRDLAADIDGTPDAPSHSILRLRAELNRLAVENQALRHQLQSRGITPNPQFGQTATNAPAMVDNLPPPKKGSVPTPPRPPVASRTHKVKRGENPTSIARRYRLPLTRLLAANPGLRPAKLQIGQVLNIPAQ